MTLTFTDTTPNHFLLFGLVLNPLDLNNESKGIKMIVSIPSYKDPSVVWTVEDCLRQAAFPQRLTLVVLEQNDREPSCSIHVPLAESLGARLLVETIEAKLAQGPCFARHRIERRIQHLLESNQVEATHIFMIDAHTLFAPRWDELLQAEIRAHPRNAILTCYPRNFSYPIPNQKPSWTPAHKPVYMEFNGMDPNNMYMYKYVLHSRPFADRVLSKGLGACMLVLPVQVVWEAPFVDRVPFLFIGEETFMWAKYFEAGYDVYTPSKDIVQTTFVRKHRANFS